MRWCYCYPTQFQKSIKQIIFKISYFQRRIRMTRDICVELLLNWSYNQLGNTMNSGNFFNKSQSISSHEKVKEFYNSVLKSFIQKLYKENRFKTNNVLNEETIQRIDERAKYYLNKPAHLFNKCRTMKEGSSSIEDIIKNEIVHEKYPPELKIQHLEEKEDYNLSFHPKNSLSSNVQEIPMKKLQNSDEEEQYEDDLIGFEDDNFRQSKKDNKKNSQIEIKKQEFNDYMHKSEAKIQQFESEQSVVDQNELTIGQCQQNLNCIVIGTFNSSSLKHKPKQQKTSIQLDNTFIKYPNGEIYCGTINMETTKLQKQFIRKQFPKKNKPISYY